MLRAFLAVREVLWEMETRFGATPAAESDGASESDEAAEPDEGTPDAPPARRKRSKRRVQRVAVEG